MDAITAMKQEMEKIKEAMYDCETESGYIRPEYRYRYLLLARQHRSFYDSIEWMKNLYHPAGCASPTPHTDPNLCPAGSLDKGEN